MRALLQRVREARVTVRGETVGAIDAGFLVLLGVHRDDGPREVEWLARKCAGLRIFRDDRGAMNRSIHETGGAALVVSQFTLYGDCRKGRRPSFVEAAPGERAEPLYLAFCEALEGHGVAVAHGIFGEEMQVSLVGDGPVTIWIETPGDDT